MAASPRDPQTWTLAARARSFRNAFSGLRSLFASEPHAWVHLAAAVTVLGMGFVLELPAADWRWLALAIGLVFIAEAFNTAIEALADAITREPDARIARAKDVAAGGVLIAAITSAAIGLWVLGPPLWRSLTGT